MAVLGAGAWGTTIAVLLARNGHTVRLWARRPELAAELKSHRSNGAYLPHLALPPTIEVLDDIGAATDQASVVVVAVPSHGFRKVLMLAAPGVLVSAAVVSLTKGLEEGGIRMSEVAAAVLPENTFAVLTGPNLAVEIAERLPAAAVVASDDEVAAVLVQSLVAGEHLRVYTNADVIGAELAGAGKNVVAIGIGMVDGLGLGVNARAALLTRGLSEITRLGVALGGDARTFAGLAGLGDLVATCNSPHSRNRGFGEQLALGRTAAEIDAAGPGVAEGLRTSSVITALAARHRVAMPIAEAVVEVIAGSRTAGEAVRALMAREQRSE